MKLTLFARPAVAVLSVWVLSGVAVPASANSPQLTDAEDDAYRLPESPAGQPEPKPPMPLLSDDTADILSATFAAAPSPRPDHDGAYTLSVSVPGTPRAGFNYAVGARFGVDCWIVHFLTPGQTREAPAGCGEGDNYRYVGSFAGTMVSSKGNTVSATFSFRRFLLPSRLKKDPKFDAFFVLSCPARSTKSWACESEDLLDFAWSDTATFKL